MGNESTTSQRKSRLSYLCKWVVFCTHFILSVTTLAFSVRVTKQTEVAYKMFDYFLFLFAIFVEPASHELERIARYCSSVFVRACVSPCVRMWLPGLKFIMDIQKIMLIPYKICSNLEDKCFLKNIICLNTYLILTQ